MPWYLKNLKETCQECGRQAEFELHDNRNAGWGYYCKKCGEARVVAENAELERAKQNHRSRP